MMNASVFWRDGKEEKEYEVEVAPGFTFEELVWFMETTYKEAIRRLGFSYKQWRFTLFSPPDYRVTTRKVNGSYYEYAYHGWKDTEDAYTAATEHNSLQVSCGHVMRDFKPPAECVMENDHWGSKKYPCCQMCLKKPFCLVCQEEFWMRKPVKNQNPFQISLNGSHEDEVTVTPGLSFDKMVRLSAYRKAVKKKRNIIIFSPPHNRVIKTYFEHQAVTDFNVHPSWMKSWCDETSAESDDLLDMVHCPTCAEDFKDPTVLGCGHSITKSTVNTFWRQTKSPPPCPECFGQKPHKKLRKPESCSSLDLIVNLRQNVMVF